MTISYQIRLQSFKSGFSNVESIEKILWKTHTRCCLPENGPKKKGIRTGGCLNKGSAHKGGAKTRGEVRCHNAAQKTVSATHFGLLQLSILQSYRWRSDCLTSFVLRQGKSAIAEWPSKITLTSDQAKSAQPPVGTAHSAIRSTSFRSSTTRSTTWGASRFTTTKHLRTPIHKLWCCCRKLSRTVGNCRDSSGFVKFCHNLSGFVENCRNTTSRNPELLSRTVGSIQNLSEIIGNSGDAWPIPTQAFRASLANREVRDAKDLYQKNLWELRESQGNIVKPKYEAPPAYI